MEPLGLFFPDELSFGAWGYVALVVVSAIVAVLHARPRTEVHRSLPPAGVRINIAVGDLFAQRGSIVVGTNTTFDTQISEDIIGPNSIQGQMLTRVFGGDQAALDGHIAKSLESVEGREDSVKTFGKTMRYPIGTTAMVQHDENRYYLLAFGEMTSQPPPTVTSSVEHLQVSLARLWTAMRESGQRQSVHMPVIGSNFARIGLTRTLLIQMILLSFIASDVRDEISEEITIWINEVDAHEVDLAFLNEWLRGVCAA